MPVLLLGTSSVSPLKTLSPFPLFFYVGPELKESAGPILFNAKHNKIHYIPGVKAVLGIFCALLGVIGIQVGILFSLNKVRQKQWETGVHQVCLDERCMSLMARMEGTCFKRVSLLRTTK